MFGSTVGFSWSADRTALFPVSSNPRENSNCDISVADHPIYSVFGSRMWFSVSADRMTLFSVCPNSIGMLEKNNAREVIRLVTI